MIQTTEQSLDSERLKRIENIQFLDRPHPKYIPMHYAPTEESHPNNSSPKAFAVTVVVIVLACFFASRKKSPKV